MKPKPHDSNAARARRQTLSHSLSDDQLRDGKTQDRSQYVGANGTKAEPTNEADTQRDGNHSQPLKDEVMRKAASAEQAKLQNNPDSLPAVGYPTKRSTESAASNPADTHAPMPIKHQRKL